MYEPIFVILIYYLLLRYLLLRYFIWNYSLGISNKHIKRESLMRSPCQCQDILLWSKSNHGYFAYFEVYCGGYFAVAVLLGGSATWSLYFDDVKNIFVKYSLHVFMYQHVFKVVPHSWIQYHHMGLCPIYNWDNVFNYIFFFSFPIVFFSSLDIYLDEHLGTWLICFAIIFHCSWRPRNMILHGVQGWYVVI